MTEHGYLLIADISGYTSFLTNAELEHATDILGNLFDTLVDSTRPPLIISKPEGDAIFCYAPDGSFLQGQTLLEGIEATYTAFCRHRDGMHRATTCTCNACQLIPSLDLKFLVHYGEYAPQRVGKSVELTGMDVIALHRLLKNHIKEQTHVLAYAYFTETAIHKMGIEAIAQEMIPHSEAYEHVGDVRGYVHDLHPVLERFNRQRRVRVDPADIYMQQEVDLPVPLAVAWDYVTAPVQRARWYYHNRRIDVIKLEGNRQGVGMVNHCVHGKDEVSVHEYVDWQPFEYTTHKSFTPLGSHVLMMSQLTPIDATHTRLLRLMSQPKGSALARAVVRMVMNTGMKRALRESLEAECENLLRIIAEDLQSGAINLSDVPAAPKAPARAAETFNVGGKQYTIAPT